jgi:hypothetical protein
MKATGPDSNLKYLWCYIKVGTNEPIYMNILPDIQDGKGAQYSDESAIGRSNPYKTYSYSENRTIGWTCHFLVTDETSLQTILDNLRILESAVYPSDGGLGGVPYQPPPVCKLRCGKLLSKDELCAVMKSYSVKFDTQVPWHETSYLPYKLDVDLQFDVVYNQRSLPNSEKILTDK